MAIGDDMGRQGWRLRPLKAESGELLHLDLLRFVASAGIVLCHSLEFYFPVAQREQAHFMGAGLALFVDVFFVISGFVIAYVYRDRIRNGADYGMFLQRRVGRLFPLHLLTLLIALLLAIVIRHAHVQMAHQPTLTLGCLASNALLLHAALPCAGMAISGVTWSLSAELFMYGLIPAFLWLGGRGAARTLALAVLAFALVLWVDADGRTWQSHFTVGRALPAFLFGMALCFARNRLARLPVPLTSMVVALVLFVGGWPARLPELSLVALAYAIPIFAIAADARGTVARPVRALAPLGQLTYPLYMLHGLFVMIVLNAIGDKILHLSTLPMLVLGFVTYVALTITSLASYQLFETPARRWIDRFPFFAERASRSVGAGTPGAPATQET